jgi:conjugative relaxase-like TrwC/TraI family protein
MLSPKTQTSLKNAKGYFEEHLRVGDYYAENERVQGEWLGAGAAELGLAGIVTEENFLALCENKHPVSDQRLTQRRNSVRRGDSEDGETANRRVFFDFTISPPKSVSVAALVGNDTRIVEAHAAAVKVALVELERFASTRVRGAGQNSDRFTRNIVAALFQHNTSRELDPHLHTHCVVFNATHDGEDQRWKALQNFHILSAQKYVENVYYHELARALRGFGYTIVNSARGDFKIGEVSPKICRRFSKRHEQIDEGTRAFLAEHPEKRGRNEKEIRERIALETRAPKQRDPGAAALRRFWREQLEPAERDSLRIPEAVSEALHPQASPGAAVLWAEEHLFERHAVIREHELWRYALAFARGGAFSVSAIQKETSSRDYIRTEDKVASRDALLREWAIVEAARNGIGRYAPLSLQTHEDRELSLEQSRALAFILGSRSFITLFRGGAGTGKSFVLGRVQQALDLNGSPSVVLAPQRQQVIDLTGEGLANAQTVSECLQRGNIPRGAVVIADEAGQIGGQQLLDLVRLVEEHDGRLILSGDTRQHGPVKASDALRAIERYSGLGFAELNEIRRQDPARGTTEEEREQIRSYREAVEATAAGDQAGAFERLEEMGAIVECGIAEMSERLGDSYLKCLASGESVVVVSQTRAEIKEINQNVRARLRAQGRLEGQEVQMVSLQQVDLTAAQMRDRRYYSEDTVLVFNCNYRGSSRGDHGRFVGFSATGIVLDVEGRVLRVPFSQLDRLTVCRSESLSVCTGDRLQLKANGASSDGRKLANGEIVTIADIDTTGTIRLNDGRILPKNYRQFQRGYAVTSYGSQGKTVDHVIFSDSAVRAATNAQQWYVTISRGRKSIQIFTADKEQLRQAISRCGERELALDLATPPHRSRRVREQMLRGVKRGREFARRLCMLAARTWAGTLRKNKLAQVYDTPIRNRQTNRPRRTNVLAP